jgi:hypothetical protein
MVFARAVVEIVAGERLIQSMAARASIKEVPTIRFMCVDFVYFLKPYSSVRFGGLNPSSGPRNLASCSSGPRAI